MSLALRHRNESETLITGALYRMLTTFLASHAVRSIARVDGNIVERWSHDPEVLEVAWQILAPSLREKQLCLYRETA